MRGAALGVVEGPPRDGVVSTFGRVLWIGAATVYVVRVLLAETFDPEYLFQILVVVGLGYLLIDHWDDRLAASRRK